MRISFAYRFVARFNVQTLRCRSIIVVMQRLVTSSLLMIAIAGSAWGGKLPDAKHVETNVMLCDSPEHAIDYAIAINRGDVDEEAQNAVGKAAGREVCDKYIGPASIGVRRVISQNGVLYEVTAYEFEGVGAMRWSAVPQN
jgi:hypothetical protein